MTIKFVDGVPERASRRRSKHDAALAALKAHPGEYAIIAEYGKTTTAYATGHYLRKRHPDFEFKCRGKVIYGRYAPVGGGE